MCGFDGDPDSRPMMDQSLFEAAREIERRMRGPLARDSAWGVFFGRVGGGMLWNDCLRIKASYDRAAALNALKRRSHRTIRRCISVDGNDTAVSR